MPAISKSSSGADNRLWSVTGGVYRLVRETSARNHARICDPAWLQRDGLGDLLRSVPALHVYDDLNKRMTNAPASGRQPVTVLRVCR